MNMIIHYCYTIFHLVGAGQYISENDDEVAEKAALAIPLVTSVLSVIGTIFCTALVDRLGRRRLLLISISGIMTSLGLLSYVFSFGVRGHDLSRCTLYSLGLGTVPWIINSEIYPTKYRTVGGVRGTMAYSASKILVNYFFLDVLFSLLVGLFIYFCVPETKGYPLEEVEKLLLEKENIIKLRES
ncbi:hypothetical protein MKX03_028915 [Papaver bracteatum]|nr:hypothetical protein MKX03_028915 [Papaver bracteatum]